MNKSTQAEIERLTEEYADKIVSLMREHVRTTFFAEEARPTAVRSLPAAPRTKRSTPIVSTRQRSYPPHCLAEGCKNSHGGPRMSFLCGTHVHNFTKAQKKELLSEWKATRKVSA